MLARTTDRAIRMVAKTTVMIVRTTGTIAATTALTDSDTRTENERPAPTRSHMDLPAIALASTLTAAEAPKYSTEIPESIQNRNPKSNKLNN
jgi:hypothetical protein